jgi:superfamily II DNA/RNA helicase
LFVIDEVDEVLRDVSSNSFLPLIQSLISGCPGSTQLVLVSATVSPELLSMMEGVLRDPVKLLMDMHALPLAGIRQLRLTITSEDQRYAALRHAQGASDAMQSMVFCSRRDTVDAVVSQLQSDGCDTAALHSGLTSAERTEVMTRFRTGGIRVLVCTDVLARGVDVQQVGLVVMYELCSAADTYLHCVGRCGRYGRQGCAVLIVNEHEDGPLRSFQALYDFALEDHPL